MGQTDCIEDDPILGTQVLGNVAIALLGPDFAKASSDRRRGPILQRARHSVSDAGRRRIGEPSEPGALWFGWGCGVARSSIIPLPEATFGSAIVTGFCVISIINSIKSEVTCLRRGVSSPRSCSINGKEGRVPSGEVENGQK